MKRKCEKCEWWQRTKADDGETGWCKRWPPVSGIDPEDQHPWGTQPLSDAGNWCGEFTLRFSLLKALAAAADLAAVAYGVDKLYGAEDAQED